MVFYWNPRYDIRRLDVRPVKPEEWRQYGIINHLPVGPRDRNTLRREIEEDGDRPEALLQFIVWRGPDARRLCPSRFATNDGAVVGFVRILEESDRQTSVQLITAPWFSNWSDMMDALQRVTNFTYYGARGLIVEARLDDDFAIDLMSRAGRRVGQYRGKYNVVWAIFNL